MKKKSGPGKSYRKGITLAEAARMFRTEEPAETRFVERRWPNGVICPHFGSCHTSHRTNCKPMPYHCQTYRNYFSVRTGTVLRKSKLPLSKWRLRFYLYSTHLKDVSSMKFHRDLGITQKTAWHLAVITALWSLVKSLRPFARTSASPASHARPNTPYPMSEPLPATPGDGVLGPKLPQAGDTPPDASGERDGPSGNQSEGGLPDDASPPTESSAASVETLCDPAAPEHEPPLPSSDTEDQLPPASAEVEPYESPTVTPPTTDDGQHAPPGKPARNRKTKSGPRQFGGRCGRQPSNPTSER